jgi:hypothetical protein
MKYQCTLEEAMQKHTAQVPAMMRSGRQSTQAWTDSLVSGDLETRLNQKYNMFFFLKFPFLAQHCYFRKEGGGVGVMDSGLKKFTNPVLLLRFLDPLAYIRIF